MLNTYDIWWRDDSRRRPPQQAITAGINYKQEVAYRKRNELPVHTPQVIDTKRKYIIATEHAFYMAIASTREEPRHQTDATNPKS